MKKKIGAFVIFGQTWTCYRTDEMQEGIGGLCYVNDGIIEISDIEDREYFTQILVHEFFHAVFARLGYQQAQLSPQLEEVMVEQLSKAITENLGELLKMSKK